VERLPTEDGSEGRVETEYKNLMFAKVKGSVL
jgi:hypothetical protein